MPSKCAQVRLRPFAMTGVKGLPSPCLSERIAFSQSEKERVRRTVEKGFARPSRDVPPGTSSEREYPPLKETSASAEQHPMTPSRIAKNATAFSSPETPTPIAGRAASQITTGGYSKIASKATALSAAGVLKTQAGAPTPAAYSAGRPAIPAALSSSQAVQKGMILARQAAETPSAGELLMWDRELSSPRMWS